MYRSEGIRSIAPIRIVAERILPAGVVHKLHRLVHIWNYPLRFEGAIHNPKLSLKPSNVCTYTDIMHLKTSNHIGLLQKVQT